jgi:hypothetical protein
MEFSTSGSNGAALDFDGVNDAVYMLMFLNE